MNQPNSLCCMSDCNKTFKNHEPLRQTNLKGPRSHYPPVHFAETQKIPFKIVVRAPLIHVTGLITLFLVKKRSASNTLIYHKLTHTTAEALLELYEGFISRLCPHSMQTKALKTGAQFSPPLSQCVESNCLKSPNKAVQEIGPPHFYFFFFLFLQCKTPGR